MCAFRIIDDNLVLSLQYDWRDTLCGAIICVLCSSCSVITCTTCYATRISAACRLTWLASLPNSYAQHFSSCRHLNWASSIAISNPRTFFSAIPNDRPSKSSILAVPANSDSGSVDVSIIVFLLFLPFSRFFFLSTFVFLLIWNCVMLIQNIDIHQYP